jgi:hypothetical protein
VSSAPGKVPLDLAVLADGTVRIPAGRLHELPLVHLVSGLDEPSAAERQAGDCASTLSGYTEWVYGEPSVVTIGWDWQLVPPGPLLRRIGTPSSNIVLHDAVRGTLDAQATGLLLSHYIDHIAWQTETLAQLSRRY